MNPQTTNKPPTLLLLSKAEYDITDKNAEKLTTEVKPLKNNCRETAEEA